VYAGTGNGAHVRTRRLPEACIALMTAAIWSGVALLRSATIERGKVLSLRS